MTNSGTLLHVFPCFRYDPILPDAFLEVIMLLPGFVGCWMLLEDFFGRPADLPFLSLSNKPFACSQILPLFSNKATPPKRSVSESLLCFCYDVFSSNPACPVLCCISWHPIRHDTGISHAPSVDLSTCLVWHIDACISYPHFENVLAFQIQTIQLAVISSLDA